MSLGGSGKLIGGYGKVYTPGINTLSVYALNWLTWILANGGTIPATTLKIIDNNFFKPAAINGNILDQLDRLNIYCGLNGYQVAANTNMIKNAHLVTTVGAPTFDNNGYKSPGAGNYLNLNYIPSSQGVKFQQNSNFQFVHVKNPAYLPVKRQIGGATFTGFTSRLDHLREISMQFSVFQCDTSGSSNTNIVTSGVVLLAGRRIAASGAGCKEIIINSNVQTFNVASTPLPNVSLYELTANYDGTPSTDVDTDYHYSSGQGSKDLDYITLDTLLRNTYAALGL